MCFVIQVNSRKNFLYADTVQSAAKNFLAKQKNFKDQKFYVFSVYMNLLVQLLSQLPKGKKTPLWETNRLSKGKKRKEEKS